MGLVVKVTSEPKGSNPGGSCSIANAIQGYGSCYFKYCYGSRIKGASSFNSHNQPIYEAVAFQLARELGLSVSDFFIISNLDRSVKFEGWQEFSKNHDPSGRDYYFASKILPAPLEKLNSSETSAILEFERAYLEAISVSDVVGKANNYIAYAEEGNTGIFYLDLGCNFAHAVSGFLILPSGNKSFVDPKSYKRNLKFLGEKAVYTARQYPVNLAHLVTDLPSMRVPLINPKEYRSVKDILTESEIKEIQARLTFSLGKAVPLFRERGILVE